MPDDFKRQPLIPLDDYSVPDTPGEETVRRGWQRFVRLIRRQEDAPFMDTASLEATTLGMLDDVVSPPACGPVIDELTAAVTAWLEDDTTPVKMIVTPPCDGNCVMDVMAKEAGFAILEAPARSSIVAATALAAPDLAGTGPLVIPRLADWFVRHQHGLAPLRALLSAIAETDRRVVVGCNSWAWAFLVKAVQIDLILPQPHIFAPFDAHRLYQWLAGLSRADETHDVRFRLSRSGADIFADEQDDLSTFDHNFFENLAATSLGIPWVAWYRWRASLRAEPVAEGSGEKESGDSDNTAQIEESDRDAGKLTLWIADATPFVLPPEHIEDALLVLQAILMHHRMTVEELRTALPIVGASNVLATLVSRGFVQREGDTVTCNPGAYPDMREALSDAGFPNVAI